MNRDLWYLGTTKRKKEDGEVLYLMLHRFYYRSPGSIRLRDNAQGDLRRRQTIHAGGEVERGFRDS